MTKYLKTLAVGAAMMALPFTLSVHHVRAVDLTDKLDQVNTEADLGETDLTVTVGKLISTFLGLLGVIFLILVIYAGFTWMTAQGDEKAVAKAKNILISAVVGLVVLLSAYAISTFVISQLAEATA